MFDDEARLNGETEEQRYYGDTQYIISIKRTSTSFLIPTAEDIVYSVVVLVKYKGLEKASHL